jgi:hypothetical protein
MLQIPKHASASLLLALTCHAAYALTIQPGTYKLEWKIPRWGEVVAAPTRTGEVKAIEADQLDKFTGLKSARAKLAVIGDRAVILDESGGDNSGYNIAYVVASYKPGDVVDVSKAIKLRLLNSGSLSSSEESDPARVDLSVGSGDTKIAQKAGIRVQVAMHQDEDKNNVPYSAALTIFGNWVGKMPSDQGDVDIQLLDTNGNGVFNDRVTLDPKTSAAVPGDTLFVAAGDDKRVLPLGPALALAGKVYKVSVTPAGDSIDIQPYTGPTGTLELQMLDGKGKLVQTGESVMFMSPDLGGVELKSGERALVPAAEYRPSPSLTFGARKKKGDPGFIATIRTKRTTKVEEGKTTVFAYGGPVSMKIDPDVTALQWTPGTETIVKAFIDAGEDELATLGLPDPIVTLMIRDAAGRPVGRARPKMGLDNPRRFSVRVFDYLKPGQYWITCAFEPGEYQPGDSVTADKPVNIVAK